MPSTPRVAVVHNVIPVVVAWWWLWGRGWPGGGLGRRGRLVSIVSAWASSSVVARPSLSRSPNSLEDRGQGLGCVLMYPKRYFNNFCIKSCRPYPTIIAPLIALLHKVSIYGCIDP